MATDNSWRRLQTYEVNCRVKQKRQREREEKPRPAQPVKLLHSHPQAKWETQSVVCFHLVNCVRLYVCRDVVSCKCRHLCVPTRKHPNLDPETAASFPHSSPGNFVLFLRSRLKRPFVKAHKSLLTPALGNTSARTLSFICPEEDYRDSKTILVLRFLYAGQREE